MRELGMAFNDDGLPFWRYAVHRSVHHRINHSSSQGIDRLGGRRAPAGAMDLGAFAGRRIHRPAGAANSPSSSIELAQLIKTYQYSMVILVACVDRRSVPETVRSVRPAQAAPRSSTSACSPAAAGLHGAGCRWRKKFSGWRRTRRGAWCRRTLRRRAAPVVEVPTWLASWVQFAIPILEETSVGDHSDHALQDVADRGRDDYHGEHAAA